MNTIVVEANSQGLVVSGSWEPQGMNVFKSRLRPINGPSLEQTNTDTPKT